MKITGPGQIQSKTIKKVAPKKAAGGVKFKAQVGSSEASASAHGVSGSAPITSVDALLALQEVPDATEGRSKGLMRAEEMLEMMEEIRKGILLGSIPVPNLRNLADLARNHQNKTDDPKLNELLSEIELRAEVELAKLGV